MKHLEIYELALQRQDLLRRYNKLINKKVINHFGFADGCGVSRRTIERFRDGTTKYSYERCASTLDKIEMRIKELENIKELWLMKKSKDTKNPKYKLIRLK